MNERLTELLLATGDVGETSASGMVRTLGKIDRVELIAALNGRQVEVGDDIVPGTSSVISLAEMLEAEPDLGPPEMVVDRIGWRGRVTGIFAREKTGKSTLMTFVASALTNCTTILGWKPGTPGRVLWFGLEEHPNDVAYRNLTFCTDPERFFFGLELE